MADKKEKEKKEKDRNLLLQHPEIKNNARGLFRNENGRTVVEEIVPRGDVKTKELICPRTQSDLRDEDLRGLAIHASTLIDPIIAKYDTSRAKEDALHMAIRTKDGGKYDGKISANTFSVIFDFMGSLKKAADSTDSINRYAAETPAVVEVEVDTGKEKTIEKQSSDIPEEVTHMNKQDLLAVKDALLAKVAAIDVLVGTEGTSKEAAETEKCPKCGTKVLKKTGYCVKCKAKTLGDSKKKDDDKDEDEKDDKKEDKKEKGENPFAKKDDKDDDKKDKKDDDDKKDKDEDKEKDSYEVPEQIAAITSALDKVAGELIEKRDPELFKIAYQLDQMSDILEGRKEAHTIETSPPQSYMSTYFNAGIFEGDADEKKYMGDFNVDPTLEVFKVKDMKDGNVKNASTKLPYKIVK